LKEKFYYEISEKKKKQTDWTTSSNESQSETIGEGEMSGQNYKGRTIEDGMPKENHGRSENETKCFSEAVF
jgi:hypothetical protein